MAMSDNDELQQIAHLRREYTRGGLRRHDLPAEPLPLFERWLRQACDAKLADPTAMVVATVDERGQPYQRIVLLKHYDEKGLVFYTNLGSRKAHQIENNPQVSLLFPWHMLERQVMVIGKAERLSTLEVVKYFHSRPRDSQIGSWVSKQSSRISARGILESKCRCRASGADSASALSRWSSGRGENTVCTIAFYTSAIAAPGK